jgi:hypothetical protein
MGDLTAGVHHHAIQPGRTGLIVPAAGVPGTRSCALSSAYGDSFTPSRCKSFLLWTGWPGPRFGLVTCQSAQAERPHDGDMRRHRDGAKANVNATTKLSVRVYSCGGVLCRAESFEPVSVFAAPQRTALLALGSQFELAACKKPQRNAISVKSPPVPPPCGWFPKEPRLRSYDDKAHRTIALGDGHSCGQPLQR